jgi:glycosyltransferase involved in cell wall biosynthesis
VAGVKYLENEGQRVTQIVREFIANGIPVLLLYFRWRSEYDDEVPESTNPLLYQLPLDLFEPRRKSVVAYPFRESLKRTCVFEFPYPPTFQWVNEFNLAGWHTVYDIIDDWEEFHKEGKAIWYERPVEEYLCANAGSVTAIVPILKEKVGEWIPDREVTMVPNGVSPESFDLTVARKELPRGEVTVGYFGYLAQAWFDWELVAATARAHPSWIFHIIGYGEPPAAELTDNVHLLGKVPHHLLYAYSQNWDVGIVPFKPTTLSKGADPIKVYEYLTLGLPVVATDIPHLRTYPGVRVAVSPEEFGRLLREAAEQPFPAQETTSFLEACTWLRRGLDLIDAPVDLGTAELLVGGEDEEVVQ